MSWIYAYCICTIELSQILLGVPRTVAHLETIGEAHFQESHDKIAKAVALHPQVLVSVSCSCLL